MTTSSVLQDPAIEAAFVRSNKLNSPCVTSICHNFHFNWEKKRLYQ